MAIKDKNTLNSIIHGLAVLMVLVIFGNSLLPGDVSSVQSGWVTSLIKDVLSVLGIYVQDSIISFFVRKIAHFTEFFVLGVLWLLVFMRRYEKYVLITLAFGMVIAGLDEFIQYFVPGRAMMFTDWLIDVSGVISGMIITKFLFVI